MKYEANYFALKEWLFDVAASDLVVEGATISDDDKAALIKSLSEKVEEVKDQCVAGKEDIIPNFPMDTIVPFIGMFYAAQFAEKIEMKDNFVEMGASLKHLDMLTDK